MTHCFGIRRNSNCGRWIGVIVGMLLFSLSPWLQAVELRTDVGGTSGFGQLAMSRNDDGSSAPINLLPAFPDGLNFFGRFYDSLYINNNGNVTFRGPIWFYTPDPFPISNQPMIAPYWGDVDTRSTPSGEPAGSNNVYYGFGADGSFVVTWYNVGYYRRRTSKLNAFQLVLTDRSNTGLGNFDVEFRYERVEWTTGNASGGSGGLGGTPAQVGFDAGDGENFYAHPASRTADVLNMVNTSNVGVDGVWRFEIREGEVRPESNQLKDVVAKLYLPTDGVTVDAASYITSPFSDTVVNGERVIEWHYDTMAAEQVEDLSFDILLTDPVPGETSVVVSRFVLDYIDVNDNPVHTEIGEQVVTALSSIFNVDVATDRFSYSADQVVDIAAAVTNLSQFDADTTVDINVRDSDGRLVATIATFPALELAGNETRALDALQFPVGTTYIGSYEVHAALLDSNGDLVSEAVASFNIVSPSVAQVSAQVTTDQATYAVYETVAIQDRIRNPAPNAQLENVVAKTTIKGPDGSLFWSEESNLPQIGPLAFHDVNYSRALGRAAPGIYEVTLIVEGLDGSVKAISSTSFQLESTALNGSGLSGVINATPNPVFLWEPMALSVTVSNEGNAALENLPVTLSVVDVGTREVIERWTQVPVSLAVSDQVSFSESWLAQSPIGGGYAAVLATEVAGEERILATQPLAVAAALTTSLAIGDKGRLLVLMDGAKSRKSTCGKSNKSKKSNKKSKKKSQKSDKSHKSHKSSKQQQAYHSIDLLFRPDPVLLPQDQLLVELFDEQGALLDSEALVVGDFLAAVNAVPATPTDLVLTAVTADHLAIRLQPGPEQRSLSGAVYSLAVTHWQNATAQRYEGALVGTACGDILAGQALSEVLVVKTVRDADEKDPHGPKAAPTKLTQLTFLEALLFDAGWSFTIVDTSDAFETELTGGDYKVVALFNEKLKLSKSVQKQLVEAVNGGLGLVYAGYHDKRNRYIEPALGVKVSRKLSGVAGIELSESVLQGTPLSVNFAFDVKPLSADLKGADSVAVYQGGTEPAIATYQYGSGQTVYMGFDLLLEAAIAAPDGPYAELINRALVYAHPDNLPPTVGSVLPITLSMENVGRLVSGEVRLTLPVETGLVDVGSGRLEGDGSLRWPFTIESNGAQSWTFWLQLPGVVGPVQLEGEIGIVIENGQLVDYGGVQLSLEVIEK